MNTVRKYYVFHEPPHFELDQVKKWFGEKRNLVFCSHMSNYHIRNTSITF